MSEQADMLQADTAPAVLNTEHAREVLRKRYASPEWALLMEVAPATGGGTRYADAVAVNLWSSRGHAVHGFEIKVSRSDWLRELKDPSKAEPVFRYCDYWHIVAPKGVVKDGELPPTWGLLELRASGLVQTVAGPKLDAQPLTRKFFASLMRRGHEQIEAIANSLLRATVAAARAEVDERVAEAVKRRTHEHAQLAEQIAKFEAETGLTINPWIGPPIGLVKLAKRLQSLQHYSDDTLLSALSHLAGELEQAAGKVRKAIADSGLAPANEPAKDTTA